MADKDVTGSQVEEENVAVSDEDDPKEALKKVIEVKVADAGTLRKTVTVTVPWEALQTDLDKQYKELIAEAIVPGFRRGRAPQKLIEKRFGGDVNEQVTTQVVSNAYLAAIEKEDIKVLGDPMIWTKIKDKKDKTSEEKEKLVDLTTALRHIKIPEEAPLEIKYEVEVKPEFDLPELKDIEVTKHDLKVSDDDITKQIERMRARDGRWAPVEDGKVEVDDLLVCDIKVTADGKEIRTLDNATIAARPQQIEGITFDDLDKTLKGSKVGDTKVLKGELPDDYEVEDLRGKKTEIEMKINDVKRFEIPPVDEAFLESQGFEDEKEYRAWVRERMEEELDQGVKSDMRRQVREYLTDSTKLELPEGLSSRQTERAVTRKMIELQRQGFPETEIEKHADELRTSAKEQAISELKLHFILEEIAEKLEVDVSEEEINGQIAAMAQSYNRRFDRIRDELAKNNGIESLYLQIRDDKCLDRLVADAKLVEGKPEKKKAKKKATKKTTKKKTDTSKKTKSSETKED